tara:strand:- start:49703 stop:49906 length:204 start_codon:yes stop_codon:yes gene_type:complete
MINKHANVMGGAVLDRHWYPALNQLDLMRREGSTGGMRSGWVKFAREKMECRKLYRCFQDVGDQTRA